MSRSPLATWPDPPKPLPVGFRHLHRAPFVNYQLNRLVSLGHADGDELARTTRGVRRFATLADILQALSEDAEGGGQTAAAMAYARGAEFFTDPTTDLRRDRYLRYRNLFDVVHAERPLTRVEIPFGEGFLPAYRLAARGTARGVVLLHGGFDSVIEEFFAIWERIAFAGYTVLAFEGPGQGGARLLHGLTFDHDWEHPVAAVLDHFDVNEATLIGLSMGGYWALRAAGREPRITRVVSWPPVYDWLHQLSPWLRGVVAAMLRFRSAMNLGIRFRMKLFPVLEHAVRHAQYLCGGREPMDAVDWMLGMNADHLSSGRVTQDVLVMSGDNDAFQPPRLADLQIAALTRARRVQRRRFTAAEHAGSHCQMGNLDLACHVLTHWLDMGEVLE